MITALLFGMGGQMAATVSAGDRIGGAAEVGQDDPASSKPPLSTIVEIQNHGERFFDETDAAVEALNQIAEQDEVWEAARAAKAKADANPADSAAQQAYRAARARFLHQRIQTFVNALKLEQALRQVHEAFCNQLDVEIAAVQKQAETEKEAAQQHGGKFRDYLSQLHELRSRIESAEDLDPREVRLVKDIERELKNTEEQKVLAKDRELLATKSLGDLEETKSQANQCLTELMDEFAQARGDLGLLQGIARNDLMIVQGDQRKVVLDRFTRRRPITSGDNRQVVSDLMGRIRERQAALAAGRQKSMDASADKNREHVETFLNNLPSLEADAGETDARDPGPQETDAPESADVPTHVTQN
jgi:hypothetical protein